MSQSWSPNVRQLSRTDGAFEDADADGDEPRRRHFVIVLHPRTIEIFPFASALT